MERIEDDEEQDVQRGFNANERKGGGLGDQEYGSTNYMTEALGYTYEDDGECDENTEEDLNYLKDPSC